MRWILLTMLPACGGNTYSLPPTQPTPESDADTDADADADSDADADADTEDVDGDGFTTAQGDCDDNDIWVNPGWAEEPDDDKDNDCDGRIDERFAGVLVVEQGNAPGAVDDVVLRVINSLGDEIDDQPLGQPTRVDVLREIGTSQEFYGWHTYDASALTLSEGGFLGAEGTVIDLLDTDAGETASGLGIMSDGTVLAVAPGQLLSLSGGTTDSLATWGIDPEADWDLFAAAVAVDRSTDTALIVGVLGGVAIWDGASLDVKRRADPTAPTHILNRVACHDEGGCYALGSDDAGQGIFAWSGTEWTLAARWPYDGVDHQLYDLAIESESGDFYVSLQTGWSSQVWRMTADGTYAAALFETGLVNETRRFRALAIRWDQD